MGLKNKDLLGMKQLTAEEIMEILDTAKNMKMVVLSGNKKTTHLQGKSVVTLFYENSTRTRLSFELASKYMTRISKSTGWPFPVKQYGSGYLTYVGKATWKVDGSGILTDPEGLQKKSAEQVCKIIFGY